MNQTGKEKFAISRDSEAVQTSYSVAAAVTRISAITTGLTIRDVVASVMVLASASVLVSMSCSIVPISWLAMVYLSLSLVTFALYAEDKRRARMRQWRIPELTLHKLELCGGWPGALLAQWYIRHKIAKTSYRRVTLAVAGLHGGVWLLLWNWGLFPT